jgi:plastocyanin
MRWPVWRRRSGVIGHGIVAAAVVAATSGVGLMASHTPVLAASQSVAIQNYLFSPAQVSLNTTETVTWTNVDGVGHSATMTGCSAGPCQDSFDTGVFSGGSKPITFHSAGTYAYHCSVHPALMKGTVVVAGAAPPPPPPPPPPPAPPPAPPAAHAAPQGQSAPPAAPPSPIASPSDTSQALASPLATASPSAGVLGASSNPARSAGGPGPAPFLIGLVVVAGIAGAVVYFVRTRNPADPAP